MSQSIQDKVIARIYGKGRGWAFTPNRFLDLGSRDAVDKALARLAESGTIRKLARGLYDYPKKSKRLGLLSPSMDAIARAISKNETTRIQPSGAFAVNQLGLSQQVPAKVVYLTDGPAKVIKINNQTIQLRQTTPKNMVTADRVSGLVIQAFRYLGKNSVDDSAIQILRRKLSAEDRQQVFKDRIHAPTWMHAHFKKLVVTDIEKLSVASFANLSREEREEFFNEAASKAGLPAHIIEKDFWVCWTLQCLFNLDSLSGNLLFKGGTSLSKAYNLIKRFSEDIDVSIHRSSLGFSGDSDPANKGHSNKQRDRLSENLKKSAQKKISDEVLPELRSLFQKLLPSETWILELDPDDSDQQTVSFGYPRTKVTQDHGSYLRPMVKIEFGARSDNWPSEEKIIRPYLAEQLPEQFEDDGVMVKVLIAARTFWEKATILHQMFYLPDEKPFPSRYSRHYSDLATMIRAGIGDEAASREDLLEAVVDHKIVFYRAAWAKYEMAKRGSLKLVPNPSRYKDLQKDWESMKEMFFEDTLTFNEVLSIIGDWETAFNSNH